MSDTVRAEKIAREVDYAARQLAQAGRLDLTHGFIQHGDVTVYAHVTSVARASLLCAPADDSLHPALGGCWSAAGAGAVQCPVQPNRPDRDHAINRHREEKRHYDGRFCA